jgi:hypothetical protein
MLLYQKTFPVSSNRTQLSAFLSHNTVVWRKQFEFLMRLYGLLEYPEEPGNDDSILWVDGNGINIDDKVKLLGILKQSSPIVSIEMQKRVSPVIRCSLLVLGFSLFI